MEPGIRKRLLRAPQTKRQRKAELLGILHGLRMARTAIYKTGDPIQDLRAFLEDSRELRQDNLARAVQKALDQPGIKLGGILKAVEQEEEKARIARNREILFPGKAFCFTGEFTILDRISAEQLTEELGGRVVSFPSGNTDYLVLGSRRSPSWSYYGKGSKVEWLETHINKVKCRLVHEDQWARHAAILIEGTP